MNFHDFQSFRAALLLRDPSIIDLAETNIWRSLSPLVPQIPLQPDVHIHRCHLSEAWLDVFGLPAAWSKYTMITSGVRHSLTLLLPELARRNGLLMMPSDVYPVYSQIAEASGLTSESFPTVPELRLPDRGDWLLLPNPLKPAGRWLTTDEVQEIQAWLKQDSRRRILIDAVYNFQTQIHPTSLALLETQQAILMHSLSKAWLHPRVMGVCIVPETDWKDVASIFRANSPDQSSLRIANCLLRSFPDRPLAVDDEIRARRTRLAERLPNDLQLLSGDMFRAGYFNPLNVSFEALLQTHGILSIPFSVFGSVAQHVCIASCL